MAFRRPTSKDGYLRQMAKESQRNPNCGHAFNDDDDDDGNPISLTRLDVLSPINHPI